MKNTLLFLLASLLMLAATSAQDDLAKNADQPEMNQTEARDLDEGAKLFKYRCTACHKLDRKLIGPALKGVTERLEEEWLLRFIRNSQEVIASGDVYAVEIFNEFKQQQMTANLDLTDDQIKNILAYIDPPMVEVSDAGVASIEESVNTGVGFNTADLDKIERPAVEMPNLKPISWNDHIFWIATAVFLLGIMLMVFLGITLDGLGRNQDSSDTA